MDDRFMLSSYSVWKVLFILSTQSCIFYFTTTNTKLDPSSSLDSRLFSIFFILFGHAFFMLLVLLKSIQFLFYFIGMSFCKKHSSSGF